MWGVIWIMSAGRLAPRAEVARCSDGDGQAQDEPRTRRARQFQSAGIGDGAGQRRGGQFDEGRPGGAGLSGAKPGGHAMLEIVIAELEGGWPTAHSSQGFGNC